jgi:hypothetical protein
MMKDFNRFEVAARLRGLLSGQDVGVHGATARRLGVGEVALRMSVDEVDPHPTFEVLMAVVRDYAVDPTWLVSGEYDVDRHRRALQDDATIARVLSEAVIRKRVGRPSPPKPLLAVRTTATQTDGLMNDAEPSRPKAVAIQEAQTRVIEGDDKRWRVREEPWPIADRRGGTCLIFDADTVVRRVRNFPPEWFEWSDADLYSLSLRK